MLRWFILRCFCNLNETRQLFINELAFVIADGFPVTRGHCLVVPKRHFRSLYEATSEERSALWELVEQTRQYLLNEYSPDGFNIGIDDGPAAGQTVRHLHIHLIPRYVGNADDPRGGVRWVMPDKAPYWKK